MEDLTVVQGSFDQIATFAKETAPWDHNVHFYPYLLEQIPDCKIAVDIGCGAGEFARLLASRSEIVYGLDLAPNMIEKAKQYTKSQKNIIYEVRDICNYPFEDNSVDCFTSIAAFHHIDYDVVLPKLKAALRPGGIILILDLYRQSTFWQFIFNSLITVPLSRFYKWKYQVPPLSAEEILAWKEHEKIDRYGSAAELRQIYSQHLPGYDFRIHLYWRCSMVWIKPS